MLNEVNGSENGPECLGSYVKYGWLLWSRLYLKKSKLNTLVCPFYYNLDAKLISL